MPDRPQRQAWLEAMLTRNAAAAYLRQHGAPTTVQAFRDSVPVTGYDDLLPWLARMQGGEADVLFAGRPVAYEITGGSSGGGKLIAYAADGLRDFQAALGPWLADVVQRHGIDGRVYLATSPATRPTRYIGDTPVGLPDGAYLGAAWGEWLAAHTAVGFDVARERDVDTWRRRTLAGLRAAHDLQLISVWSPSFMLRLLDHLPDAHQLWPQLKLVSCWADASSQADAAELQARLPQARLQPKGLMSTECVATVPDAQDRPLLTRHGFFEFVRGEQLLLAHELQVGDEAELVATTASGLYRYRTGDRVACVGSAGTAQPQLRFVGRSGIACDLVGEKLVDAFVQRALACVGAWCFLTVAPGGKGYVLVAEAGVPVDLPAIEARLGENPQYAYARTMNQLLPLAHRPVQRLHDRYVEHRLASGTRLADIKPVALMPDASWLD